MSQIRGMYIRYNQLSSLDLESMENKGLTDIFLLLGSLGWDYEANLEQVNLWLNAMKNTDLKLHLCPWSFNTAIDTQVDPTNSTHITTFTQNCANMVEETGINIHLDDYFYPSNYYNAGNEETQQQNLVNFANAVKTAVHDVNSAATVSAALTCYDYKSSKIDLLAPVFDFVSPMIYRLVGTIPSTVTDAQSHTWVKHTIQKMKDKAGNNKLVNALITYKSDTTHELYTTNSIISNINASFVKGIKDYVLCCYTYSPTDVYFPKDIVRPEIQRRTV